MTDDVVAVLIEPIQGEAAYGSRRPVTYAASAS